MIVSRATTMSRRPAIIFDFGNVVAHFDYNRAGERFGRSVGLTGEVFIQRARDAGFVELLKVYESGGMTSALAAFTATRRSGAG